MATLVLINGAPGSGKSTLASCVAAERPLALALDIDAIRHNLGGWHDDQRSSGRQARRLAVAIARRQLGDGHDVVIGQYLARTEFIDELEAVARQMHAPFVEIVLVLDAATLASRLAARAAAPTRPEHAVNNRLVGPGDAPALVAGINRVLAARPHALRIDGSGTLTQTLDAVRHTLPACRHPASVVGEQHEVSDAARSSGGRGAVPAAGRR